MEMVKVTGTYHINADNRHPSAKMSILAIVRTLTMRPEQLLTVITLEVPVT
jgi:hypothetical protein